MKRYLVTGGTGFIGSAIVGRLAQKNSFVRVLDNEFRSSSQELTHFKNVEYIKGDIRNLKNVEDALTGIDVVIHLAYINGTKYFYENPDLVLEVGVKGMINVLEGARKKNVKELYLASSSEVYQTPRIIPTPENVPMIIPDPLNPRFSYGAGKIISEMLSLYIGKKIFQKVVIFRPHNVYGPNMGREHVIPELILKITSQKSKHKIILPIQGNGLSTRAFIYIDDFVDAFTTLLKKGKNGEIYNIGSSNETSIRDLIQNLEMISGKFISIKQTPQPAGGTKRRCPDVTKIKKLGFSARTPLFEGLQKTFMWYNNVLQ